MYYVSMDKVGWLFELGSYEIRELCERGKLGYVQSSYMLNNRQYSQDKDFVKFSA